MRTRFGVKTAFGLFLVCVICGWAQETATAPLVQTGAIPLANVRGRIDHFAFDPKNRLFVSALGNNTEEVIDLSAQKVVHTITSVPTPQGVAYSPETNKIFVASAKGKLYIYDGTSFALLSSINFGGDVDNCATTLRRNVFMLATATTSRRRSGWSTRRRISACRRSSSWGLIRSRFS